ncbi:CYTH and CHAD domain-containing protein [Propioniferax innocua]|uniref:CHAD domain-containing protein n=1 Tax=Propioniferax innocua TaxID=1753 RepID=A0A542ZBS0_9ACTN|nr:CYTH and CHAD domain-containing protein [Propioniferax innocua]TQL57719.1 CHAD domain-containing protein [Propioniferax innocua]
MSEQGERALEVERKYALPEGVEMPDLRELGSISEPRTDTLVADYHDTAELTLSAARTTLRHRSGGADAGWHLKTRAKGDARHEVRLPGTRRHVPAELRAEVAEVLQTRALLPVVRLITTRTTTELLDDAGVARAEIVFDEVDGRVLRPGVNRHVQWVEAEVELVGDEPEETFADVEKVLFGAGLQRSPWASKLAHVLDGVEPATRPDMDAPAIRAVAWVMGTHVGRLQSLETGVWEDAPDAVHQARVAARRMRSILQIFGSVFERDRQRALRQELRWAGAMLGGARDAEVLIEEFSNLLDGLDSDQIVGPVHDRIMDGLRARHGDAHTEVRGELTGERWDGLLAELAEFVADPPSGKRSGRADDVLVALAQKSVNRVQERFETAKADPEEDENWHDVRKAAKAARYAYELLAELGHESAEDERRKWKAVASTLGEMQDARLLADELEVFEQQARDAGEPLETYRTLAGRLATMHDEALSTGRRLVTELI